MPTCVSPYDYWQYWRNTEDADVGRFLKLFTELPLDEIARLEALEGAEINEAKKVLATEATALVHGRAAADAGGRDRAPHLRGRRARRGAADGRTRPRASSTPASACSARSCKAGLVSSNGEARRQIKGGGLKVNDATVTDEKMTLTAARPDAAKA